MTAISIIGGGRWARTIAGVLAGLPDVSRGVLLHSRHNAAGLRQWIAQKGLGARIDVSQEWPDYKIGRPHAVIVANRAADHMDAALPALDAGIAVLVEKPMAIGAESVRRLQERAVASGAMLAASHVFLFARYFDAFALLLDGQGHIRSLEMVWQDGQDDVVRGEVKSYDPALPVFDDVLPHVLPMLSRLARHDPSVISVGVEEGGAMVRIQAAAANLPVSIHLARNAKSRQRVLVAHTADGPYAMDFSAEPGVLSAPGAGRQIGDPLWDSNALRPLGAMLTAFLQSIDGGRADSRLSSDKALIAARFADDVRARYRTQQKSWLEARGRAAPDAALAYALQELSAQG